MLQMANRASQDSNAAPGPPNSTTRSVVIVLRLSRPSRCKTMSLPPLHTELAKGHNRAKQCLTHAMMAGHQNRPGPTLALAAIFVPSLELPSHQLLQDLWPAHLPRRLNKCANLNGELACQARLSPLRTPYEVSYTRQPISKPGPDGRCSWNLHWYPDTLSF